MLILTRKQNESIIIDDDIKITILGVNKGQVRIGLISGYAMSHPTAPCVDLLLRSLPSYPVSEYCVDFHCH